jgi:dihydropyrimidine dehydrogenase (NAD+) subunit PreT
VFFLNMTTNPEIAAKFPEVHPPLDADAAVCEANRCLYCFDAPCIAACPTHIDVPRFIKKIAQHNLAGSAQTILNANILGASCSRVCPVEVLCEGACVMHRYNKQPIQIGLLQRHAMDAFWQNGATLRKKPVADRSAKIACIGAGPASLACAAELRLRGFSVRIFDRRALPGGLNTHGVAEYKLRPVDSLREIDMIRSLGVEFAFGQDIASQAALAELEKEYAFVFLGVGLGEIRRLAIPGENHGDVINALEFIERYKTRGNLKVGRRVVVVGAGNTAIDAARAAVRLGAEEVHILYRRGEQDMPAFAFEYEAAVQEGVRFHWYTHPLAIHVSKSHPGITSVECTRVNISTSGEMEFVPGSSFHIPCEMVIPAIGQSPLMDFLELFCGLQTDRGRVVIDRATGKTSNPKYFAGGDCVNGGREVVDAVADGKRAALAIARMLEAARG